MLRPNDSTEASRRIIQSAVATSRGADLRKVRDELGASRGWTADQLGWGAAFKAFPYSQEIPVCDGSLSVCDLEEGVASLVSGGVSHQLTLPYVSNDPDNEIAWCALRVNPGGSFRVISQDLVSPLEASSDFISTSCVSSGSITSHNDIKKIVESSRLSLLRDAISNLLMINQEAAMKRALGQMSDMTIAQIISTHRLQAKRGKAAGESTWSRSVAQVIAGKLQYKEPNDLVGSFYSGTSGSSEDEDEE